MFEYKIQKAWETYTKDFGLGRIAIFISFYNLFLLFYSGVAFGKFQILCVYPIVTSMIFFFLRKKIIKYGHFIIFLANTLTMFLAIVFNYYLIGEIDNAAGSLTRLDPFFNSVDLYLLGTENANYIFSLTRGPYQVYLYDFLISCYMLFYILPFYGAFILYNRFDSWEKYKLGRYFASIILFFLLNYLCYLIIPVTGPQYFIGDNLNYRLPFSEYGHFLWSRVREGQTTFIDCFPSGHTGLAFLVTIWFYRVNHLHKYIMTILAIGILISTLAIRFHYLLDVFFAFPLAFMTYKLAFILFPAKVRKRERITKPGRFLRRRKK